MESPMTKKKNKSQKSGPPRIKNRKAFHEYHILEKLECGLSLTGTEVKALRNGEMNLEEAYARLEDGELWLIGATIGQYSHAAEGMQHDPTRKRKLLVHKRQLWQLEAHVRQKGKTLVPLAVYFHKGWAKCEIGIAEGKRSYDKREAIKKRDQQRDMDRAMRRYR
jgi:SsrA-binding protein